MNRDPIVEQELWRSVAVYFASFLVVGALNIAGYISVEGIATFILAFIITLIHFALMVRYRRKEQLTDPSISSIIDHLLQPKNPENRSSIHPESGHNFRSVLAILVIAYLIYRYAI
ncbi:hypothetical protein [Methanosarcina vacuolata]|uniref:Uncharacterized protein n=1 Tax=Methanosarcina vacuolata Z-761 TaxID=1434123 RepID=A0A0E3Q7N8_9EURY|nr:hypothetical protein [Methanosarcina vacuolata]AKB44859.1 hypothetical protein MSVAZ_2590 [Methanosarcina vacuolata Z-761]